MKKKILFWIFAVIIHVIIATMTYILGLEPKVTYWVIGGFILGISYWLLKEKAVKVFSKYMSGVLSSVVVPCFLLTLILAIFIIYINENIANILSIDLSESKPFWYYLVFLIGADSIGLLYTIFFYPKKKPMQENLQ